MNLRRNVITFCIRLLYFYDLNRYDVFLLRIQQHIADCQQCQYSITFLIKNVLFPAAKFGRKVDNAMKKSFTQPKYNIFIINNLPSS